MIVYALITQMVAKVDRNRKKGYIAAAYYQKILDSITSTYRCDMQ